MRRLEALLLSAVIGALAATTAACDDSFEGDEAMEPRALQLVDSIDALLDRLPVHMGDAMAVEAGDALALEKAYYEATAPLLDDIRYWLGQLDRCADAGGKAPDTEELWRLHDDAAGDAATHLLITAFTGDDLVVETYRREEMLHQIAMTDAMSTLRSQPVFAPDVLLLYTCPPLD